MLDWTWYGFSDSRKSMRSYKAITWKLNCGIWGQDWDWRYRFESQQCQDIKIIEVDHVIRKRIWAKQNTEPSNNRILRDA